MISIIVPVYHVEAYIKRCVDSILRQTISDIEIILVDDGSNDNCPEICDDYSLRDSRIKVIHKKNGGLSDARNAGLAVARGEFIAFVDSDDWLAPLYLEKLLRGLQEADADICECEIYRTSGETCSETLVSTAVVYDTVHALEQLIQDGQLHQYVWNKLYRRKTIGDISFSKGKTNEDEFWTYHVFGQAKKVVKISDVLYNYYQRPDSIMGAGYNIKRLDALEAKTQRQQYLERNFPELSTEAKINLYFSCVYAGQMVLKYIPKQDLQFAEECINKYVNASQLRNDEISSLVGGSKFWYQILRRNFWLGCRLRNLTKRGM